MSESAQAAKDGGKKVSACCPWKGVAALVLLRLVIGWHFFSEGMEKVEYDSGRGEWQISSEFAAMNEGFLNAAKGPLADFYHRQVPTTHDWRTYLVVPKEMTPEDNEKLTGWVEHYVSRRKSELAKGQVTDPEFVDFAPGTPWAKEILADWRTMQKKFNAIRIMDEDQRKRAEQIFEKRELDLADFVAEQALDMQAYQHELWRLEQQQAAPGASEIPYRQERLAAKESEVAATPRPWVATIRNYDQYLADDLMELLTPQQHESSTERRVKNVVTNPQVVRENQNNWRIMFVVAGVGLCLLIGFMTPIAALVGALFLLTVMASQPPWVAGARTEFFYYQLVEFAALLLLAATSAGRYAGIDRIIHHWWSKPRPTKGA